MALQEGMDGGPAIIKSLKHTPIIKSKEERKAEESMQSSTTPDPGHHMGK